MSDNEFKKDNKAITSDLSGASVDKSESVLNPPKRSNIYQIITYIFLVMVVILFGILVAKSLTR